MLQDINSVEIDVLVIGSGGSGLCAALEAKHNGANVLVLSKTYPTHSQTCQAQGGINAAINNNQASIESHINDTYIGGKELGNIDNISLMCNEAKNTIEWLDRLGVPFSRDEDNSIAQRVFGAASEIRTCYSSDYTGLKILHTLYDNCIKEQIAFLNEYQLLSLIKESDRIIGITALNIETTEIVEIYAKTVILATGGYANIYNKFTTNSHSTTGDGIVAALNVGCELSNLEMIQFHPTAMAGNNILISESARGEGGYLVDQNGKRFVDELKTRDEVARSILNKLNNGDKVFLDLRHIDKDKLLEFMPQEYRLAKEFYDVELDKDLLQINPAAHYTMGGIKTNVSCETTINNLYAVGECAQNDIHGANRLGGNSLQEIVTFGRIAGKNAAKKSKEIEYSKLKNSKELIEEKKKIEILLNRKPQENFYKSKELLGKVLFENMGLFRDETTLKNAQQVIEELEALSLTQGPEDKIRDYNKNLMEFIEYQNLLKLSNMVVNAALNRKESRGAHFRVDYEESLKSYKKNSIIKQSDSGIEYGFEELSCN